MSLVDGETEKTHATCKERERDKKEYAREETREKRDTIALCKYNMSHTESLYIVTLVRLNMLREKWKRCKIMEKKTEVLQTKKQVIIQ